MDCFINSVNIMKFYVVFVFPNYTKCKSISVQNHSDIMPMNRPARRQLPCTHKSITFIA